jgi:hypothetical protein
MPLMHSHIGLWIDHRRAVIVFPSKLGDETSIILSQAEWHQRRAEGALPIEAYEARRVQADDVQDRKFEQQLQAFYDEVIAVVHAAASLFVFGPGEAKGELAKRLAHEKPTTRSVNVEAADKLTDRQIAAKVREHFLSDTPVIVLR